MGRMRCYFLVMLGSAAFLGLVRSQEKRPKKDANVDFAHDIAPLIKADCA